MATHRGQYNVQAGQMEQHEIVDVVPGQTELNQQIRAEEEKVLGAIQANGREQARLLENQWEGISKLSKKLGDVFEERKKQHRADREKEILMDIMVNGVDDNLTAHFREGKELTFNQHIAVNEFANKVEEQSDAITAQEFRDLSEWEKIIVAEGWARNEAKGYGAFFAQNLESTTIDVPGKGKVTYGTANAHEKKAIEQKIKREFIGRFAGLNEALVADVVKPELDQWEKINDEEQRQNQITAIKQAKAGSEREAIRTNIIQVDSAQGAANAEKWIQSYMSTHGVDVRTAETAFRDNLVDLVKSGQVKIGEIMPIIMHEHEGKSGVRALIDSPTLENLVGDLQTAHSTWLETKKTEMEAQIKTDVALIQQMGERSDEQNIELTERLKDKYEGAIPIEISDALKGHIPDDVAERFIESALASQDDKLYDFQLNNVSQAVYDKYKDKVIGGEGLSGKDSAIAGKYIKALTDQGVGMTTGEEDTKTVEWLTLNSNLIAAYNTAYEASIEANGNAKTAHQDALRALDGIVNNEVQVAALQVPDWQKDLSKDDLLARETYGKLILSGMTQSAGGKWRGKKINATKEYEQDLVEWSQGDRPTVKDMPEFYVDLAKRMGITPMELANAQLKFLSEDATEIPESDLAKNEKIIKLLTRRTRSSVTQAYAINEIGDQAQDGRNDVFNNKKLVNPDI